MYGKKKGNSNININVTNKFNLLMIDNTEIENESDKEQENIILKYEERITNYELRISEYRNEIVNLQTQIKEITEKTIQKAIDKPTYDQRSTTNSNNKMIDNRTLNMIPMNLTQEYLLKTLEDKFTENHLMQGQKGLADFFVEYVLISQDGKYLMKCTDPSRKTFIYIDNEGRIQKDVNADKFTRMINGPVKKVSKKIYDDIYDRYSNNYNPDEDIDELDEKETDEDRINFATDRLVELTNLKTDNSEFVKRLVSPLTN
jgi:hypothetical protein